MDPFEKSKDEKNDMDRRNGDLTLSTTTFYLILTMVALLVLFAFYYKIV